MENKKEIKYLTFEEVVAVDCDIEEQETSVAWYRDDETIRWFTSDNTMITTFKWKVREAPDMYKMYVSSYSADGKPMGYFIEMPLRLLSFRTKIKEVSDAQRENASRLFKEMHAKKNHKISK